MSLGGVVDPTGGDAIVAAVVTIIVGFGAALIGALASWRSQTRVIKVRERSIAAALLQDLDRIRRHVPTLDLHDPSRYYNEEDYPGLHRWVQPLIADLGARDGSIVGGCMRLEELLEDHRLKLVEAYRGVAAVALHTQEVERHKQALTAPNQVESPDAIQARIVSAQTTREDYVAILAKAAQEWRAADAALNREIKALETALLRIVADPIPDSFLPAGDELMVADERPSAGRFPRN